MYWEIAVICMNKIENKQIHQKSTFEFILKVAKVSIVFVRDRLLLFQSSGVSLEFGLSAISVHYYTNSLLCHFADFVRMTIETVREGSFERWKSWID